MKLDLAPLPIRLVTSLLNWCIENNVDRPGVQRILESWNIVGFEGDMMLDITEEEAIMISLKFS